MMKKENEKLGISVEFPEDLTFKQLERYEKEAGKILKLMREDKLPVTDSAIWRSSIDGAKKADFMTLEGVTIDELTARQGMWLAIEISKYIAMLKTETNDPN